GVVNLEIGRTLLACLRDILRGDALTALLYRRRYGEKHFQFWADVRVRIIKSYGIYERVIAAQMVGGGRAMTCLAEIAIISSGHQRRNHLALAAAQATGSAKQHLCQFEHRPGGLGPKREPAYNTG